MGKFNLIETLRTEQELLMNKITKARENGDVGTYKNLITALREITRLIHDEEMIATRNSNKLYFEVESERTYIYYEGVVYRTSGNFMTIAKYISRICNGNKSVEIYGDCHGLGLGLLDSLNNLGYTVRNTKLVISDVDKNKFLTRESINEK